MFHTPAHKQTNPAALPAQIAPPMNRPVAAIEKVVLGDWAKANHLYEVEVEPGFYIDVHANNRNVAASLAKGRGFDVRSVNMVG